MDSVAKLPPGAAFTIRQGQATLSIGRDAEGHLVADARCDSISRRCIYLEKELSRISSQSTALRSDVEQTSTAPNGPTGWQWFWIRLGQMAAAAVAIRLIIYFFINKLKS